MEQKIIKIIMKGAAQKSAKKDAKKKNVQPYTACKAEIEWK